MHEYNPYSRTAFGTDPAESLADAIKHFTHAFNEFQNTLMLSESELHKQFLEQLKENLYKPVYPQEETGPISLFEIGVMYVPGTKAGGTYSVNSEKLNAALSVRKNDIKALFTQQDGLLGDIAELIKAFLENELPCEISHEANRFLNEACRLEAMF